MLNARVASSTAQEMAAESAHGDLHSAIIGAAVLLADLDRALQWRQKLRRERSPSALECGTNLLRGGRRENWLVGIQKSPESN
jgi:hypothetical protein